MVLFLLRKSSRATFAARHMFLFANPSCNMHCGTNLWRWCCQSSEGNIHYDWGHIGLKVIVANRRVQHRLNIIAHQLNINTRPHFSLSKCARKPLSLKPLFQERERAIVDNLFSAKLSYTGGRFSVFFFSSLRRKTRTKTLLLKLVQSKW